VVICLAQGAELRMAQLMPLPLTVYWFSKIQIGVTFLVPAHLGSPAQRAVKRACVRACVRVYIYIYTLSYKYSLSAAVAQCECLSFGLC